jgi:hypothetical protein
MKIEKIMLPKFLDARGNLSFIEQVNHIPFKIQRTYWIYDVPGGEKRGGHAYKENEEFIVALSGSFDVQQKFNKFATRLSLLLPKVHKTRNMSVKIER